ncbi:NADH-ubiquinone/plastoquinone oxidoreductase chain 4L-domain-containing protein [Dunaliella salina]|uniref:NADH-ubiquinone/plastoquinone oxidoreductase chain 4L-domain-containing protein n=1 Tax=Dunaliella salina TaxID=3046 RepID=A0ABQ7GBA8_DUNSA|nr:NADH-ubiquinone/plastoquinone oxidoreductase chain 4L-domain-containing protein [Dunaliella salina]|eukprot:KAF5831900.1 NADH-ubiquinone/plastoquinone oxidoreductase chain 4L-domain-containing protein [Dunaliella salina]
MVSAATSSGIPSCSFSLCCSETAYLCCSEGTEQVVCHQNKKRHWRILYYSAMQALRRAVLSPGLQQYAARSIGEPATATLKLSSAAGSSGSGHGKTGFDSEFFTPSLHIPHLNFHSSSRTEDRQQQQQQPTSSTSSCSNASPAPRPGFGGALGLPALGGAMRHVRTSLPSPSFASQIAGMSSIAAAACARNGRVLGLGSSILPQQRKQRCSAPMAMMPQQQQLRAYGDVGQHLGNAYLLVTDIMFWSGLIGAVVFRRNLIVMLLTTEIVMLACNLNFLFGAAYMNDLVGILMSITITTVAACETAIGLALCVTYFHLRSATDVETLNFLK